MPDRLWQIMSNGAEIISPDALLSADVLLDLYGEDIRARAYVTTDPVMGEMMLRPDFTVPIVQAHMSGGVEPARYAYRGSVWRKQDAMSERPREYGQIGIEVFDSTDPDAADADVFDRVMRAFKNVELDKRVSISTGDVGLMRAAVASLQTSELRRQALIRHLWRPRRFNALLARFAGEAELPAGRDRLSLDNFEALIGSAGPEIGLRSVKDVKSRIERLIADRDHPKIPRDQASALRSLQGLQAPLSEAADAATALTKDLHLLGPAIKNLRGWSSAIEGRGYDLASIGFQGTYGLTSMEYYDGFVFGMSLDGELLATGGRYDALTEVLGGGSKIAAVGAVIRPDTVAAVLS